METKELLIKTTDKERLMIAEVLKRFKTCDIKEEPRPHKKNVGVALHSKTYKEVK